MGRLLQRNAVVGSQTQAGTRAGNRQRYSCREYDKISADSASAGFADAPEGSRSTDVDSSSAMVIEVLAGAAVLLCHVHECVATTDVMSRTFTVSLPLDDG